MGLRIFLLVAALAGFGCNAVQIPRVPVWRAPADAGPVQWGAVLLEVVEQSPGAQLETSDGVFTLVQYDFALELIRWSRAFLAAEQRTNGFRYTPESFDCDKFAKAFTLAAEVAAARAGVKAQPLAARIYVRQRHAFGGVGAAADANGGHALVALGTDRGILIVEPQTGVFAPLEEYPNRANVWKVLIGG